MLVGYKSRLQVLMQKFGGSQTYYAFKDVHDGLNAIQGAVEGLHISQEDARGVADGVNTVFRVANPPSFVTVNGITQGEGADYRYNNGQIAFITAPTAGAKIKSFYVTSSNAHGVGSGVSGGSSGGGGTVPPSTANANYVYAGPTSGVAAAPTFRALVAGDIPTVLNPTTISGTPATLTIDLTGSTTSSPARIATANASGTAGGTAERLELGDSNSGLQCGYGQQVSMFSYWGLHVQGARQQVAAPSYVAGAANDPSVTIDAPLSGTGETLRVNGIATATTPTAGDSSTNVATTAFVTSAIAATGPPPTSASANTVYAGPTSGAAAAPTFRLLAAGDIPNITESQVTNLVADLAAKAALASPTFTGTPWSTTPPPGDNSTRIATTAFVATSFAPLASPTFTGAVAVPTMTVSNKVTSYNGVATAGEGLPHIVYAAQQTNVTGATAYTYDMGVGAPGLYRATVFIYPLNPATTGTWTVQFYTTDGGWNPLVTTIGSMTVVSAGGIGGSVIGCAYHGNNPVNTLKVHLTSTVAAMNANVWISVEMLYTTGAF